MEVRNPRRIFGMNAPGAFAAISFMLFAGKLKLDSTYDSLIKDWDCNVNN